MLSKMLFLPLVAGLSVPSSTSISPFPPSQTDLVYYLAPKARSTNVALNGKLANAVNGDFVIGKETTRSYCNVNTAPCDTLSNATGIILHQGRSTAETHTYVKQLLWVADNGALRYTGPNTPEKDLPTPTQQTGFSRIERFEPTVTFAAIWYKNSAWAACPRKVGGDHQVFLAGSKSASRPGCEKIELDANEFQESWGQKSAYEYDAPRKA